MATRTQRLMLAFALALSGVGVAHAQATHPNDATVLPVWNKGRVEAVLLLEPTDDAAVGARMRFSDSTLDAAFGLSAGDSLGLLCDRKAGVASAIGNLINHCMLATFGDAPGGSRRATAAATLSRPAGKLGLSVGTGHDNLPAWLSPGKASAGRVEQNDLTVFAQKNISREGFVTIRGTVARARLVPANEVPALADRWSMKSVSVGGGFGAFSGNIVGRVVDEPGAVGKWEGFGLGLTWRTPWSGQLTVGADNLVTRGRNPFGETVDEQGTVPYVRYEQDL